MTSFIARIRDTYGRRGLLGTLRAALYWGSWYVWHYAVIRPSRAAAAAWLGFARRNRTFNFLGKQLPYLYNSYNTTWKNERIVEVPLAWEFVREAYGRGGHVLEVGNVLAHYFPEHHHEVVDLYEKGEKVINSDVVDFQTNERYDLIISVSTMEHVGWDCGEPLDPEKTPKALRHLKTFLRPGGRMVITFPVGYNPNIDFLLKSTTDVFSEVRYLKRISADNRWVEVPSEDALAMKYNEPYFAANALAVAVSEAENL